MTKIIGYLVVFLLLTLWLVNLYSTVEYWLDVQLYSQWAIVHLVFDIVSHIAVALLLIKLFKFIKGM